MRASVLEGTGLLRPVNGGAMTLRLNPVAGARGTYDGMLDVSEVRLKNAPIVASILDAISIVGPDRPAERRRASIYRSGRQFSPYSAATYTAKFKCYRSVDGDFDRWLLQSCEPVLDMQGVVSPIYLINGIGSLFTRKGEGLIGFNFNIGGDTNAPRVAVNPLSVFTPGMFREIFRRRRRSPRNETYEQARR